MTLLRALAVIGSSGAPLPDGPQYQPASTGARLSGPLDQLSLSSPVPRRHVTATDRRCWLRIYYLLPLIAPRSVWPCAGRVRRGAAATTDIPSKPGNFAVVQLIFVPRADHSYNL